MPVVVGGAGFVHLLCLPPLLSLVFFHCFLLLLTLSTLSFLLLPLFLLSYLSPNLPPLSYILLSLLLSFLGTHFCSHNT